MWKVASAKRVDNDKRSFPPGSSMYIVKHAHLQTSNINNATIEFANLIKTKKTRADDLMEVYMNQYHEMSSEKNETKSGSHFKPSLSPLRSANSAEFEDKENHNPVNKETSISSLPNKNKLFTYGTGILTEASNHSELSKPITTTTTAALPPSPVKSDGSDYSFINVQTNIRKSVGFREARFKDIDNEIKSDVIRDDKLQEINYEESVIGKSNNIGKNYTTSPFKEDGDVSIDDATFNKVELYDLVNDPIDKDRLTNHNTPYVNKSPVQYASLPSRDPLVIKSSSGPKSGRKKRLSKMSLDKSALRNKTTNVNSFLTNSLSPSGLKNQSQYFHLRQSYSHIPVPNNKLLNSSIQSANNNSNDTDKNSKTPLGNKQSNSDYQLYDGESRYSIDKMVSSTPTEKTSRLFSNTGLSSTKTSLASNIDTKIPISTNFSTSNKIAHTAKSPFTIARGSPLKDIGSGNKLSHHHFLSSITPKRGNITTTTSKTSILNRTSLEKISHPFLSPSKSFNQSDNVFVRVRADTQSSAKRKTQTLASSDLSASLSSPKKKKYKPSGTTRLSTNIASSSTASAITNSIANKSSTGTRKSELNSTTSKTVTTTTTARVNKPKSTGRGLTSLSLVDPTISTSSTSKTTSSAQYTTNPFISNTGTIVPSIHDLRFQNNDSSRLSKNKKSLVFSSNTTNNNNITTTTSTNTRQSDKKSLYSNKPILSSRISNSNTSYRSTENRKQSSLSNTLKPPTLISGPKTSNFPKISSSQQQQQQRLKQRQEREPEIPDFPSDYEYEDPSNVLASWGDASTIKELLLAQRSINPDDIFGTKRRPISIVEVFGSQYGGINASSGFKAKDILSQRDIDDYDHKMGWK